MTRQLLLACILLAGIPADGGTRVMPAPDLVIERSDSPWHDYTASAEEEQAGFQVEPADSLAGMEVPAKLKTYLYRGKPLLAIDRKRRKVFVNGEVFGKVHRPDATRLAAGESVTIGILRKPQAFADMAVLAEFLLRAQIVRTYAHLRAELTQTAQRETSATYLAEYQGLHEYYTNARHSVPIRFAIVVNRNSGEMKVMGL